MNDHSADFPKLLLGMVYHHTKIYINPTRSMGTQVNPGSSRKWQVKLVYVVAIVAFVDS